MAIVEFQNNQSPYLNAVNLNKIQEGNVYSTNEVEIGKWIDNKPIYRKVVTFSNSVVQSSLIITTNIENIDTITKLDVLVTKNNQTRQIPYIQQVEGTAWIGGAYMNVASGDLVIFGGSNLLTMDKGIAIIEYTKTTD